MYVCPGLITLLYSRNWHNIVNQLYFNKKLKKKICSYLLIAWPPVAQSVGGQATSRTHCLPTSLFL